MTPHETREANTMHTHRNIPVVHYALDAKGRPVEIKTYPNAVTGTT